MVMEKEREREMEHEMEDETDDEMDYFFYHFDEIFSRQPKAKEEPEPEPEPEPKKPRIEQESEYKVLWHIVEDDLITASNHPPFKLRSLINAAYANQEDLSRICEISSSPNGESLSNNSEWSRFFTEDGHLRFDLILPLLPHPPPMTGDLLQWFEQTLNCTQMAVTSYNRNKGTEYELVAPVLCTALFHPNHFVVHHANFLAKLKHSDSPVELFFAEVAACDTVEPGQDKVLKCSILTTQNSGRSSRGCCTTDPLSILHPEEEDCPYCIQHLAFEDSD